jgi:hypothetical protein
MGVAQAFPNLVQNPGVAQALSTFMRDSKKQWLDIFYYIKQP